MATIFPGMPSFATAEPTLQEVSISVSLEPQVRFSVLWSYPAQSLVERRAVAVLVEMHQLMEDEVTHDLRWQQDCPPMEVQVALTSA